MNTQTSSAPLAWCLLDQLFRIVGGDRHSLTAEPGRGSGQPFLALGGDEIAVISTDPGQASSSGGSTADTLWRGLALDHPGIVLPARTLARLCAAMDAAAVPLTLASLPGKTILLFPASLAGRALATMHQAGIDRITI